MTYLDTDHRNLLTVFFFSSRRRHTRWNCDWSSDVCSSDLTTAINRILSNDDLDFVSRSGQTDVRRLFLKERKMLAMHWFRKITKQVRYLMNIHLRLAACTASSSLRLEVTLCLRYVLFTAVCNSVLLLFWLLGPFKAKRTLAYVIPGVERVFTIFSTRLKGIDTANLSS